MKLIQDLYSHLLSFLNPRRDVVVCLDGARSYFHGVLVSEHLTLPSPSTRRSQFERKHTTSIHTFQHHHHLEIFFFPWKLSTLLKSLWRRLACDASIYSEAHLGKLDPTAIKTMKLAKGVINNLTNQNSEEEKKSGKASSSSSVKSSTNASLDKLSSRADTSTTTSETSETPIKNSVTRPQTELRRRLKTDDLLKKAVRELFPPPPQERKLKVDREAKSHNQRDGDGVLQTPKQPEQTLDVQQSLEERPLSPSTPTRTIHSLDLQQSPEQIPSSPSTPDSNTSGTSCAPPDILRQKLQRNTTYTSPSRIDSPKKAATPTHLQHSPQQTSSSPSTTDSTSELSSPTPTPEKNKDDGPHTPTRTALLIDLQRTPRQTPSLISTTAPPSPPNSPSQTPSRQQLRRNTPYNSPTKTDSPVKVDYWAAAQAKVEMDEEKKHSPPRTRSRSKYPPSSFPTTHLSRSPNPTGGIIGTAQDVPETVVSSESSMIRIPASSKASQREPSSPFEPVQEQLSTHPSSSNSVIPHTGALKPSTSLSTNPPSIPPSPRSGLNRPAEPTQACIPTTLSKVLQGQPTLIQKLLTKSATPSEPAKEQYDTNPNLLHTVIPLGEALKPATSSIAPKPAVPFSPRPGLIRATEPMTTSAPPSLPDAAQDWPLRSHPVSAPSNSSIVGPRKSSLPIAPSKPKAPPQDNQVAAPTTPPFVTPKSTPSPPSPSPSPQRIFLSPRQATDPPPPSPPKHNTKPNPFRKSTITFTNPEHSRGIRPWKRWQCCECKSETHWEGSKCSFVECAHKRCGACRELPGLLRGGPVGEELRKVKARG